MRGALASESFADVALELIVCGMFCATGASALIFETLWFADAGLVLGNAVWASSAVLTAFMMGLAVGGLLAMRCDRRIVSPLPTFARLQALVGVTGIALVLGLPRLAHLAARAMAPFADSPTALNAVRLVLAVVALGGPASAMGAGLPLVVGWLGRREVNFGRSVGLLYGANTVGAVIGVAASDRILLGALGMRGTALAAAAIDLLVAGAAWALARHERSPVERRVAVPPPFRERRWVASAFLSGFCFLALEVVWLRLLMLMVTDTPSAFASILAVVLAGIGTGAWLGSTWAGVRPRLSNGAGPVAYASGASVVIGYLLYPSALQRFFDPARPGEANLLVTASLVLPTSVCSGLLFTLVGARGRTTAQSDLAAAAELTFANTLGSGLGALAAGFVLLPVCGAEASLFGVVALYGVIGGLLTRTRSRVALVSGATVYLAVAASLFPFGALRSKFIEVSARRWMQAGDMIVAVREGRTATTVHIRHNIAGLSVSDQLAQNAYSMSANNFAARRYMKLFVYLPFAIHPHLRSALVIGFGIGNTTQALTAHEGEVERIAVVDPSLDLPEMSRRVQPVRGKQPLDDPRLRLYVDDGRYFLQSTTDRFDLITGEPPPPEVAGVVNLYTREYFGLVRNRLADGGIVTYWLPMMDLTAWSAKSLVHAFCDVFEDCSLWHASSRNFMLVGTRSARGPVSEERFTAQWRDPAVAEEMASVGFEVPGQLSSCFIGDSGYLTDLVKDVPPLSDDWPKRIDHPEADSEVTSLIWSWRDTGAARRRFVDSSFIRRHFPPAIREEGPRHFEDQRLLNDLLFPGPTQARQVAVLDQVLHVTPLRLPVLLLLSSDPDIQQAIAAAPSAVQEEPGLALHRLAGFMADRDYSRALQAVRRIDDRELPLPGLREYIESVAHEEEVGAR